MRLLGLAVVDDAAADHLHTQALMLRRVLDDRVWGLGFKGYSDATRRSHKRVAPDGTIILDA